MSGEKVNGTNRDNTSEEKRQRMQSLHILPDVNHNFGKQMEILDACVAGSNQGLRTTTLEKVMSIMQSKSNAIRNSISFLIDIKLLEGSHEELKPTANAVNLYYKRKADSDNKDSIPEEGKPYLREVVANTWFWDSAKQFLDFKGSATRDDLILKLAEDNRVTVDTRGRALNSIVGYLVNSGLVVENGDAITIGDAVMPTSMSDSTSITQLKQDKVASITASHNIKSVSSSSKVVEIHININVDPSSSEEQIRKIIRSILEEVNN